MSLTSYLESSIGNSTERTVLLKYLKI